MEFITMIKCTERRLCSYADGIIHWRPYFNTLFIKCIYGYGLLMCISFHIRDKMSVHFVRWFISLRINIVKNKYDEVGKRELILVHLKTCMHWEINHIYEFL